MRSDRARSDFNERLAWSEVEAQLRVARGTLVVRRGMKEKREEKLKESLEDVVERKSFELHAIKGRPSNEQQNYSRLLDRNSN